MSDHIISDTKPYSRSRAVDKVLLEYGSRPNDLTAAAPHLDSKKKMRGRDHLTIFLNFGTPLYFVTDAVSQFISAVEIDWDKYN